MAKDRKSESRQFWLQTLEKHRRDFHAPDSPNYWSTYLDTMSRDEIIAVQNDKLRALTPFLYENSSFYQQHSQQSQALRAQILVLGLRK